MQPADEFSLRTLLLRNFRFLPLNAVKPLGWLKRQLEIQADGLTGHIDEFWEDLGPNNMWLGGDKEGWERGPYYVDGLLPLAYLLDDSTLKAKAQKWVNAFLEFQDEDGWIGPIHPDPGKRYDPWPVFVVFKVLMQYYGATSDHRVIQTMRRFCQYLQNNLNTRPLRSWAMYRWGDLMLGIHWLFEKTGEKWLLDLGELIHEQGYDWQNHFRDFIFTEKQPIDHITMETHVVNNAMGIKTPGVWFRQSHSEADRQAVYQALHNLDKYHGQVTGVFSGDEHFAGKNPSQGTELCAVVEYMYSLEELISILGDPIFADRLEKIAFNALPAAFKPDMWAHQYDQQVNQVICNVAKRDWSNGDDANIFGLEPNFGCCTANMHQGWPKFATSLWMATPDGGLAAAAYAPCRVSTTVTGKQTVTIVEETDYPFSETIRFTVESDHPVEFPLYLRVPEWAERGYLTWPDGRGQELKPGVFHAVRHNWRSGDIVQLTLPMELRLERRYHDSIAVKRGPLVFSLKIGEEWRLIGGTPPHGDWEVYPTTPWNYGLDLDLDNPDNSIQMHTKAVGDMPFSPEGAPIELKARGRRIPEWQIEGNSAGPVPKSPAESTEDLERLTLIPYGCTNLRITEFPLLGSLDNRHRLRRLPCGSPNMNLGWLP